MTGRKYKGRIGIPVPGLKGITLLHDTLYKDGRPLKTQERGYVVFRLDGEKNTRCVLIDTARYAVATGRDVFLTSTKRLAAKAKKGTYLRSMRDHILWMQTVLMGMETGDANIVFAYLHSCYHDDLIKVLDWHTSRDMSNRIEIAVWNAMKNLSEKVIGGDCFIYAPAPYLIQCVKAAMSERTYY